MRNYTVLIVFACLIHFFATAQVYNFPIRPGVEQWNSLKTEKERFNAMQVLGELLDTMSTADLLVTCLNYPAIIYITAFNSVQQGMNHIIQNFNGLQELLHRKDAPALLLLTYQSMDSASTYIPNTAISKKLWFIRRSYFEFIIAQPEIINIMDMDTRLKLLKEARRKLNGKTNDKQHYCPLDIQATLLIMARTLDQSNYNKFQNEVKNIGNGLINALETGTFMNQGTVSAIIELSDMYIKENLNP